MNYLFHLHLSESAPLCQLGNLMGDFVKGRLDERQWHPQVISGLRQHRALDSYAHRHPCVRASKSRINDRFGILKPIMIDIFYDHFLAKNWQSWVGGELAEYSAGIYRQLHLHDTFQVDSFRQVAKLMSDNDWLSSYRDPKIIALVLKRIGRRLKHRNNLAEGYQELSRSGQGLEEDCYQFLLAARAAAL